jgi:hypothetical protein
MEMSLSKHWSGGPSWKCVWAKIIDWFLGAFVGFVEG